MFTNKDLIRVEAFQRLMVDKVLASAPDAMATANAHQRKVLSGKLYIPEIQKIN